MPFKFTEDRRPTDYEYALLAKHIYEKPREGAILPQNSDWRVREVVDGSGIKSFDFYGAIYENNKTKQLVVVFRGTPGLITLAWLENINSVLMNNPSTVQKLEAFNLVRTAIRYAKEEGYQLSFACHSLGAFLAELSVFFCHCAFQYPCVNAVTFESPGIREMVNKLDSRHEPIIPEALDIVGYVSYPNIINTCNEHVGTLYSLTPAMVKTWTGLLTGDVFEIHSIDNILALFENGKLPERAYMAAWPAGSQRNLFWENAERESLKGGFIKYKLKPNINPERVEENLRKNYKLLFKGQYIIDETLSSPYCQPLRHFRTEVNQYLRGFYEHFRYTKTSQATERLKKNGIPENMINALLSYTIKSTNRGNKQNIDYIELDRSSVDITDFRKLLLILFSDYSEQAAALMQPIQEKLPQTPEQLETWELEAPTENPDFIQRSDMSVKMKTELAQSKPAPVCVIYGLGGAGKTQLAAHYFYHPDFYHPEIPYSFRGWFDAKDKAKLAEQFRSLALAAGLISEADAKNPDVVRNAVLKWLEHNPGWLLVFDEAPNYETIAPFLPKKGGRVIITSQEDSLGKESGFSPVPVPNKMVKEEAVALITKLSGLQESFEQNKKLAKTLGYLPLAIAQAAAYIRIRNQQEKYTIDDYINDYRQTSKILLSHDGLKQISHKPIAVTWLMNMEALEKKEPLARYLLNYCAYLGNKHIPRELLNILLEELSARSAGIDLTSILDSTRSYSLLDFDRESSSVSIHQLVQEVIQDYLQDNLAETGQQTILLNVAKALIAMYPEKEPTIENVSLRINLVSHMRSIAKQMKKFFEEPHQEQSKILLPLLLFIAAAAKDLGDPKTIKDALEQALFIQEKYHHKDKLKLAMTLVDLAQAYADLGDPVAQKKYLSQVLEIQKSYYGKDDPIVVTTLIDLAHAYSDLGDPVTQKDYLRQALEIQRKSFLANSLQEAAILVDLAAAHSQLNEFELHKQILEQALNIYEKYYPKNDYRVMEANANLAYSKSLQYTMGALNPFLGLYFSFLYVLFQSGWMTASAIGVGLMTGLLVNPISGLVVAGAYIGYKVFTADAVGKNLISSLVSLENTLLTASKTQDAHKMLPALIKLADAYVELAISGKTDVVKSAKELLERILEVQKDFYGEEHPKLAITLTGLAKLHLFASKEAKIAKEYLEKSLEMQDKYYGKKNWKTAETLTILAATYLSSVEQEMATTKTLSEANRNDLLIAKSLIESSVEIQKKHYGNDHWKMWESLCILSIIKRTLDEQDKGFKDAEKAHRMCLQNFGEKHINTKRIENILDGYKPGYLSRIFGHAKAEDSLSVAPLNEEDEVDYKSGIITTLTLGCVAKYAYSKPVSNSSTDLCVRTKPLKYSVQTNVCPHSSSSNTSSFFQRRGTSLASTNFSSSYFARFGRVGIAVGIVGVGATLYGTWQTAQRRQGKLSKNVMQTEEKINIPTSGNS